MRATGATPVWTEPTPTTPQRTRPTRPLARSSGVTLGSAGCALETVLPIGCEAGEYQDQEGHGSCKVCPEGFFCLANSTDFVDNVCPTGHYCPNSTTRSNEFLCPAGTFNALPQQIDDVACVVCTAGSYCMGTGNDAPTSNCSDCWYCIQGASSPTPTDLSIGGRCAPGEYCPGGIEKPIPCDPGYYCERAGLAVPHLECSQGIKWKNIYVCKSAMVCNIEFMICCNSASCGLEPSLGLEPLLLI